MAYTAKDLYVNGLARLGLNFPDGLVGEENDRGVYTALNGALTDFYLTHEWDFLLTSETVTTTAADATYSLNANMDKVYGVYCPSLGYELKPVQTRAAFSVGTAQGVPRYFTVNNGTLTLMPTPSSALDLTVAYYQRIPLPNATAQGATALYTYLDTLSYASLIPEWTRTLAELYVARHVALLVKDREAHGMVQEQIAAARRVMDDNVRKATAPVPPQTRWDWNQ